MKLAVRVKEHKDKVEKINKTRVYTRDHRKQSEWDRWKSPISDHVVQSNHVIDWESAWIVT